MTYDIAVGVRAARDDPASSASASRFFWWLYRRLVQPEIPPGGVDVFACTRAVARHLASLEESHTSLVGLLYWLGYRRVEVPYTRPAATLREERAGAFAKAAPLSPGQHLLVHGPADHPDHRVGVIGVLASFSYAVVVFVFWVTGRIDVPGYTPLMLSILFMTSAILIGLGVVGSYVWRTYENSKRRPTSVVMSHEEFGSSRSADVLP